MTGRLLQPNSDKPDTVATILGIPEDVDPKLQTKVALKSVKEKLKRQEREAWQETTKNLVVKQQEDLQETLALQTSQRLGSEVQVVDRI